MFPIDFVRLSCGREVTVILKNGDVLTGLLGNLDGYMNLKMRNGTLSTKNGQVRMLKEVYILGVEVMNIKVPDVVIGEAARIEKSRNVCKSDPPKKGMTADKGFSQTCGIRQTYSSFSCA